MSDNFTKKEHVIRRIKIFKLVRNHSVSTMIPKRLTSQFRCTLQITSCIPLFFLLASSPSIRWQCLIRHGVLSDTLPASIENPDSGTVPTWSRLPIAAIAKADLRTFTRGTGVDRAEDNVERVERSVIDKQRLRSILSRLSECVNGSRFLQMRVYMSYVCAIRCTRMASIYRMAKMLAWYSIELFSKSRWISIAPSRKSGKNGHNGEVLQ